MEETCIKGCGILKYHKVVSCPVEIGRMIEKYIVTRRIGFLTTSYLCSAS